MCRSDAEVEALRNTLPNVADYDDLIEEDAIVFEPTEGVLARLVTNCLSKRLVANAAKLLRTVHGDLSNRGSIIYRGSKMNRERKADESLSLTKAVLPSMMQLVRAQKARLGLTGPYSDFFGYFDKTPRTPFCRETAWSLKRPDIFEISRPLVEEVEYVNKRELPDHWQRQREFMRNASQDFKYKDSIFSTVTINLNVRCTYHTDDGDFRGDVGNLVVLELGRDDSGILVMPRERVAFLVRPTDCLLMNVHHMHGNLPLTVRGTRLTAVLYAREGINNFCISIRQTKIRQDKWPT
jgi:hypothetical protein